MARQISVAGKVTGIPGVYQNKIDLAGGSVPGVLESGVVCIVGECEGSIPPKIPTIFRNSQQLKALLGSGDLYDAARFAFQPSRDDPQNVRGAQKVIAVRANPATQSAYTLLDSTPLNLIDLLSRAYGIKANEINVEVEAGTLGASSRKITIGQIGENDEVGDNLGYNSEVLITYTGDASTAVAALSRTQLTTVLAGDQTDGSVNLTINFSTYDTLSKLSAYVNAQTGYSLIIVSSKPDTYKCEDLDYFSSTDIKAASASVTIDATSTSLTFAGLTAGDVVLVEDEQMYVVTAGSPNTVVRGYNDTLAAAHTAVTGYSYLSVLGINKAVIDWINTYSARITATRNTAYNAGIPDTLSETYLTGGGEGSISSTDWQDALDAVRTEKYNYISVTSTDLAIHSKLKTHLNDKWGLLGQEAIGHVGLAKDATLSQIRSHTKSLQSSNICLHFQDSNRSDDQGVDTNYAPWAKAVMEAGIQAGSAIGTPLTRKSLDVTALGQNSNIDVTDDSTIETLIEYGVCVARYDGEEYRIIRSLTTWTNNDDAHLIEPGVRTALAWTVYKVRDRVRFRHLGKRALAGNALSIKSTARTTLEEIRDVDEAIVNGNREVGGRIIPIPAFDNIQVSQTGNVAELSYDCTPVNGTDFVKVNTTVVPYQDVA